ncbi:MAG TPA: response regulator, partial [Stellaceae bacterium]|nr:response regulator [Stellaceae bacterium]
MIQENQQTISALPGAVGPAPALPRVHVLVVDDDDEFRESLSLNLMDEGFAVTSFANGPAALEHVASGESADVILLDWRMPG